MSAQNRTQLVLGILLALIGVWFIAVRQLPALRPLAEFSFAWPFYIIAAGVLLFVIGLLTATPRMAIPAVLVAGIGGILYYQSLTQDWESWSFMWTLMPGFVGLGEILAGLLGDGLQHSAGRGLNLIIVSAVLFLIFAAIFNRLSILGNYGVAVLLILLGLYVVGRGLVRPPAGS